MIDRYKASGTPLGAARARLAAAALLAATGCASAERPAAMASSVSSGPVFLRLQQRGSVGGLAVTPLRVEEDSRCPTSVQCIQAGNVRLAVRIGGQAPRTLTRGQPSGIDSGAC